VSFAWTILILSGMLEAVWATALSRSNGLRKFWPTVIFLVSVIVSTFGLALALRELPVGTAYAVWVGIGALLTAAWAIISGAERATVLRVALLLGLVGCVAGLKLVS
jgi:quaternary ammonium compound-resistance protein SugE